MALSTVFVDFNLKTSRSLEYLKGSFVFWYLRVALTEYAQFKKELC